MCKTDITKAFRIVPIVPQEHYLLGFNVNGLYCVDTRLSMGLKCSYEMYETFRSGLELLYSSC